MPSLIHLVFITSIFLSYGITWAGAPQCHQFYAKRSEQDVLIHDLARLQYEIYKMQDLESKVMIVNELKIKMKQVSQRLGFDVRALVAKEFQVVQNQHLEKMATEAKDNEAEKDARKKKITDTSRPEAIHPDEINKLEMLFSEDLGGFQTLGETYFYKRSDKGLINGGGVSWTADERYVVLRNGKTKIFDTEKKEFISFAPASGFFSKSGHLWAENKDNTTLLTDIDSGKVYGPFKGNPVENYFFEDYLITHLETKNSSNETVNEFWYHSLTEDFTFELGDFFALSKSSDKIIRKGVVGSYEVVNRNTGTVRRTFRGQATWTHGRSEFFTFSNNGTEYVYRVADEAVFPINKSWGRADKLSPDGKKLFFVNGKDSSVTILDLTNNKPYSFASVSTVNISQDGSMAILTPGVRETSILVDLSTMTSIPFTHPFNRISPDGEWLYTYGNKEKKRKMYHLPSHLEINFEAGFYFHFIGNREIFVTEQEGINGSPKKIFIGNGLTNEPFKVEIGDTSGDTSPSGAFVITYKGKKTVLLGRPK